MTFAIVVRNITVIILIVILITVVAVINRNIISSGYCCPTLSVFSLKSVMQLQKGVVVYEAV